jgi:DNA gyrase inhibitor GyrI
MSEIEVNIVQLEPMRFASVYGFGPEPETIAWEKLNAYAGPKGYLDDPDHHRIFGFNNPDPSKGSPNYGYELWIEVSPDVQAEGEVRIQGFEGGLYAVTRCPVLGGNYDVIGQTWKKLVAWRENSKYKWGAHQWLEKTVPTPDLKEGEFVLDLYLPIAA